MNLVNIRRIAWDLGENEQKEAYSDDMIELLAQKILERLK